MMCSALFFSEALLQSNLFCTCQLFEILPLLSLTTKKATRTINLIRHNLYSCSKEVKARAFLSLVRPTLSYASSVWDPYTQININQLEMVQRRAARFVFKNYLRHVSVTALIKELGWSELSSVRKRDCLCMMFKIVNTNSY